MIIKNQTIFAPATQVGNSGITVIRISGSDSFNVISKIFSKKSNEFAGLDFNTVVSNSAHHGFIWDEGEIFDEAVITIFRNPNSFTGEDVVEVSVHGGSYIYRKISNLLSKYGITAAAPGEFSKRAYLNGKMDLAQAEAVADIINAKTELSNKLALEQLTGKFSDKISTLKESLINYCSLLELELDFSEEGIDLVSREELVERIDAIISKFKQLTRSYESGKIIKNGVNLAIVGKPNVGKSSIFNYLLNENRAIVSDIPGTTRDYLQEPLIMGGIVFNLIDTAGIRASENSIEQEGVKRSKLKINESDLVLEVEDLSNLTENNSDLGPGVNSLKLIKAYNKADIVNNGSNDKLSISALTGLNMDALQNEIISKARNLVQNEASSELIITNERHRDCLLKSCQHLVNAKEQIEIEGGNELISFDIREAMHSLTEIIGTTSNVDILNNIFSKFCIGK